MDLNIVTGYRRATHRDDLRLSPGEALLGGGSWLFSEPQPATTGLVDLTTLGWPAWELPPEELGPEVPRVLRIGATCTVAELAAAPAEVLGAAAGLVRSCAEAFLMSFKIQSVATVGGNLCLALPAGAMISLASALDAEVLVWTPDGGARREAVASFVRDAGRSSLQPGEVLRAVDVPLAHLHSRTAFRRIGLAPLGRSSALVIGRSDADGATTLTVTAATRRPVQLRFAGVPADGELERALGTVDCWYADAHGAADWRRAVTTTLATEICEELAS
ncbi:FAD binding domain-containing protein [Rhodococcus sp. X156]|uniref:FAD binding domain-containing protein n=1 Tax=Rhodococcus sp. X156 TaxID=2499145 RepID=UPI000FDAA8AA|nr:FAD binding domain-containing protein [Rhodococcus sp. X156]